MNKFATLILISTLSFSGASQAQSGWFDSLKSILGFSQNAEQASVEVDAQANAQTAPSVPGMISTISENLKVSSAQAEGGLASLMNYVKGNVSSEKFAELSSSLPGLEQVLNAAPELKNIDAGNLMSRLLNKVAEHSEQLESLNIVRQQFAALGLSPDIISGFITQIRVYLDTYLGRDANRLFTESLTNFI
jgi:hypothetical protein